MIIPLVAAAAELAVPLQHSVASEPAPRDSAVAFIWRTVDGGRRWKIVLRSPLLAP